MHVLLFGVICVTQARHLYSCDIVLGLICACPTIALTLICYCGVSGVYVMQSFILITYFNQVLVVKFLHPEKVIYLLFFSCDGSLLSLDF